MTDIKEILQLTPDTLAAQQHTALKNHVIQRIKAFNHLISDEKYEEALTLLSYSPAGDDHGCDNQYLDFSETGQEDIGDVLSKLSSLKTASKKK